MWNQGNATITQVLSEEVMEDMEEALLEETQVSVWVEWEWED
jgi:hypothetical protein